MEQTRRPAVWAYILIFVGLVFLLNNFNLLPWESWQVIWRFWPFILIFIGLQMVFGRSRVGSVISAIVSLILIVMVLLILLAGSNGNINNYLSERLKWWNNIFLVARQETKQQSLTVGSADYDGVVKRTLEAELGVADFSLNDDETDNFLKVLSKYFDNYETPILDKELDGDELKLKFNTKTKAQFFPGFFQGTSHDLTLGQSSLRTDVDIKIGTGTAAINLSKVGLDSFDMELGTGRAEVDLGKASLPTKRFALSVGTGQLVIRLPEDIGLKINHQVGLGKISVDGQGLKDKGTYISKNYDTAVIKLEIDAAVGTGEIEITHS
jgi:hypothetical protein